MATTGRDPDLSLDALLERLERLDEPRLVAADARLVVTPSARVVRASYSRPCIRN